MTAAIVKAGDFAIVGSDQPVGELIRENLGGEQISPFDLPKISVPSGGGRNWTIPSVTGDMTAKEIAGVIIFTKIARVWFEQSFEESGGGPPDCFSDDGITGNGTVASQHDGLCATCPKAAWGSDRKGGKGQDCSQIRPIFMLREKDRIPILVRIPPTSIKAARLYLIGLANASLAYHHAVTRLTLLPAKNEAGIDYATVEFECVGPLDKAGQASFDEVRKELEPMLSVIRARDIADDGEEGGGDGEDA